jgi:hypothetical protein
METRLGPKDRRLELGLEFLFELLLFLYPFGADQMGIPHNFWVGFISWVAGLCVGIRIFWIFPWWGDHLRFRWKGSISAVAILLFGFVVWKPVQDAYARAHAVPPPQVLPFSIKVGAFLPGGDVRFKLVTSKSYCIPDNSIYVDITNNEAHFVRIDAFGVELVSSSGAWKKTRIINTRGVLVLGADLQHNLAIGSIKLLDQEIENKNLGPKETMNGWIFIETDQTIKPVAGFRFSISDQEGNQFQSEPTITSITSEPGVDRSYFVMDSAEGKFIDLTNYARTPCQPEW